MMSKKSAISCKMPRAPTGWKFQDNTPEFISMLRIEKEDWSMDWKSNEVPKDYYISAQKYDVNFWEIIIYDIYSGHTGFKVRDDRNQVIKIMIEIAKGIVN